MSTRLRRSLVLVTALASFTSLISSAQAPATPPGAPLPPLSPPRDKPSTITTGTGVLRGRVARLDNGEPLRNALVTVTATANGLSENDLPAAFTDNSGRFELKQLPAARYLLTASKGGFVTLQYGQRRPNEPGQPIEVANAGTIDNVNIALPLGGIVTGQVVDENGEPAPNATIQVLRQRYVRGQRQLSASVAVSDTTDDRGEFRIYGIPPGMYYVSASKGTPRPGAPRGSGDGGTTFYPGTSSPDAAKQVTIGIGKEVAGISFTLVSSTLAAISVTVRTPDGQLPPPATTVLLTQHLATGGSSGRSGRLGGDGSVAWQNLPPATYVVSATQRSGETASARVNLEGSDVRLQLTPSAGVTARGRIIFDADAAAQSLSPANVRVRPVSVDPLETSVGVGLPQTNPDWTFETGVTPGARLIRPYLPTGWVFKSVRLGDADITDTPLTFGGRDIEGIEVRVTDKLTEVSGTVRNPEGRAIVDATVVLFADDLTRWGPDTRFVAVVRPDQNGQFTRRGLPPTTYVAVALDYLEPGEETNPEMLRQLQAIGTRFTLADRESKSLDLGVSALP